MTRRQTLVALAVVAAVAVAVPAIAAVDDSGVNFKRISLQARKLAHKALKKANRALNQTQGTGGVTAPGSSTSFSQVVGAVSTDSENQYVQLGGPAVIVTVPASGTIQVAAQATIGDDAGAISLYQDGAPMPGQSDFCEQLLAVASPGPPLIVSPDGVGTATWSTPATPNAVFACANSGPAGPVTFQTTAGQHTYELRYAYCGCIPGNSATFSNRRLWVTGLP